MICPGLIIFGRSPASQNIKTRLGRDVGVDNARLLYQAFVEDSFEAYLELDVPLRYYITGDIGTFNTPSSQARVSLHRQEGDTLGDRMHNAFIETFAAGVEQPVIVGTDSPTLPPVFLQQAFQRISNRAPSITIGPSLDGGYYALGMNELYSSLFSDMKYSHADVFADTFNRAVDTRAEVSVLPEWYDVDDIRSLAMLAEDLEESPTPAPCTAAVLKMLGLLP
jgi:uncharacterized protein